MSALQLRRRIEPELLRIPEVTGVSNLDDRLRIYVEGTPDIFPRHIEGVRVEVVKTGKIKALHLMNVPWFTPQKAVALNRTQRYRPVPGGCSVGHPLVSAGTMGTVLMVGATKYGLSNNHVLCYDEETEVLTLDGFKLFKNTSKDDYIATLNPNTEEIEYHKPTALHKYHYKGKMMHFKRRFYDLLVTPEHDIWCKDKKKNRKTLKPIKAIDFKGPGVSRARFRLKRDAKWNCLSQEYFSIPNVKNYGPGFNVDKIDWETWLKFMGLYLSDGCFTPHTDYRRGTEYIVQIRNKDEKILEETKELFRKMGLNPQNVKWGVRVYHKQLYSYVSKFGKAGEKYIPKDIKNLPPEQLRIFFDYMVKGDGCYPQRSKKRGLETYIFTQKSKRLVDDLQEVALKLGMVSAIGIRHGSSYNPEGTYYQINIYNTNKEPFIYPAKEVSYDGMVYDVTIPNHILLVRRNGKCVWSGNSAASTDMNPRARIGDPIYQPGVYDRGTEIDTIGTLAWYQPMYEQAMNLVDAALLLPADPALLSDDILGLGPHTGLDTAKIEEVAQKSGRTTAVTQARILDVNATLRVSYGAVEIMFTNQIITDYMANGGDSGSALLNLDNKLIGLLFAGSEFITVHNHIGNVMDAIGGVPGEPGAGKPFTIVSALPAIIGSLVSGLVG